MSNSSLEKINNKYDIVILAVSHDNYLKINFSEILKKNHILANQSN